jgi:UDP-N-acetylmuramoylalanine-D-glutamate ligase
LIVGYIVHNTLRHAGFILAVGLVSVGADFSNFFVLEQGADNARKQWRSSMVCALLSPASFIAYRSTELRGDTLSRQSASAWVPTQGTVTENSESVLI